MTQKNLIAQTFYFLAAGILFGYLLSIGRSFLQPIVIAVILWYLIISLTQTFNTKLKNGWQLPEPLALTVSIVICTVCFMTVSSIVTTNVEQINQKLPAYQINFINLTESTLNRFAPELEVEADAFLRDNIFAQIDFSGLLTDTARTLGGTAGKFSLVLVYTIFLLLEYKKFPQKLERLTDKGADYAKTVGILTDISKDLNSYFKIKTVASLATALLSYIVMLAFGVDFAAFWALIIFLLNYIPTIGSPIATAFPILIALIQFGGGYQFILIGVLLILIQLLIGTIIEPRYQGNTLNISPLVILLSLAFWASLWGALGALLCVPITAIFNIVLSKFERTQWISLLISADGRGKGYQEFSHWQQKLHKRVRKQVKKLKG